MHSTLRIVESEEYLKNRYKYVWTLGLSIREILGISSTSQITKVHFNLRWAEATRFIASLGGNLRYTFGDFAAREAIWGKMGENLRFP